MIGDQLGFWAEAAVVQGDRVAEGVGNHFRTRLDAMLLAIAIRNVIRAAEWAQRQYERDLVRDALNRFDSGVPHARNVRNALEHFDKAERGEFTLSGTDSVLDYEVRSVRYEDQCVLWIGDGIGLDVRSGVLAAERLADEVQNALWGESWRPADGP